MQVTLDWLDASLPGNPVLAIVAGPLLVAATPFPALRLRFYGRAALCGLEIPSRGRAYRAHAVERQPFAGVGLAVVVATPGGA